MRGPWVIFQEWMHCYSIKIEILWERGNRTRNDSWVGQPAASVTLSFSVFEKKYICLTTVTELSPELHQQIILTWIPFSAVCFAVSHHHNSSNDSSLETILCLLHRPLDRISDQTALGSDPIPDVSITSIVMLLISSLSKDAHSDWYLLEWLWALNNECTVLSTVSGSWETLK